MAELDIVIPVYNEGRNIVAVLDALGEHVRTPFRVLICYDYEGDDTLPAVASYHPVGFGITLIKNRGQGVFGAITTGFADSRAPAVLMLPADDDYNAPRLDAMVERMRSGCELVVASRFIPGGCMDGSPLLKAALIRISAFALRHFARLPTSDPSNGFRLFSRRLIESVPLESTKGFTYSLELLVKCHRLGWPIGEVPVEWHERKTGKSRFQILSWLPEYLRWFRYAFATTWLRRPPESVARRGSPT